MKKQKPFFITFEGDDGCGKSTQIKLFLEYLQNKKYDFISTREPGGTTVAEEVRRIMLHLKEDISAEEEFLLVSAGRANHVRTKIMPALAEGKIVVSDRYYDSSLAYQGAGGVDFEKIKRITEEAIQGCEPDLTFWLCIEPEKTVERRAIRNSEYDRFEEKNLAYHKKVFENYSKVAKEYSKRVCVINADQSIENVFNDVVKAFEKVYK